MRLIRNTNVESLVKGTPWFMTRPRRRLMVDFFKQVPAADSRRVISSFALSIMVSRHWGADHMRNDTSLVNICQDWEAIGSVDAP